MYTNRYFSTDKVLIAHPTSQTFRIAWSVQIAQQSWADADPEDTCYFRCLVEDAMLSVNVNCHEPSFVRLVHCSPVWIMQSMFGQEPDQLILRIVAHITILDQSVSSNQAPGKRSMLALPSQIAFVGYTDTILRTLDLNYCALNLSSGDIWQERPPNCITVRQMKHVFTLYSETPTDGPIGIGSPAP